ncbi:MAG: MoaD/ThiS family protein [Candidatus Methanomethyliaceae archaeon]|nr:MoaD/ThiS family protein [Candidatus Methanomethyliaceae archaeon]
MGVSAIPAVRLRYLAVLKGLSEEPTREVTINGSTLGDLFDYLREVESPQLKSRLFEQDGSLRPDIVVFINGADASLLDGMNAQLKDGDEITVLPTVHGG